MWYLCFHFFSELQVDVGFNRNITLPVNSITIYGAAWPPSPKNHPYSFEWSKVFSPANSKAIIAGQHTALLSLSNIDVPGVYGLKLTVRSEASYGHGFVNVTVFPAVRNNKPPVAVIYPKFKEITLPIQKFVLDGSRSSDDDKIVKYEWELVAGPLNYYLKKKTNPVLQLTKLDPGNYDFKLTVTDSDGVKNSTLARIKVNKAMDYKPVALPGPDVLLYLPQNSVVLNGSGSYDDNGIVRYAWTKLHGSPEIADMQGTTSPVLHVTNLVEGHYVFQLNVTDTAGQMASATVTVVVQPEDNKPPKAVAGPDKDLVSPDDSTFLDGSSSSDDRGIVSYLWRKVSGPNSFVMSGAKTSQLKLTKLKLGTYVFELIVTDDRGLQGKDTVNVFVKKDDNKAPVAKINGDVTVKLPKNEAVLNGSLSSDDYGIVRYEWTRSSNSPAIATILEDSDHKPILRLAGLVVGKYTFTLKVVDQKGLYSVDKATITVVKGDAMENLVEVKIDTQGHTFTNQNKMNLLTTISLSLGISGDKIKIDNIHEINSGGISVVFYIVDDNGKVQKGAEIVSTLKSKAFKNLNRKYWIVAIDTYLCHNNCSGHGVCDNLSKRCVCNSFWMENFIKAGIQGQSNCEWSILYVIIICASCVIAIVSIIWFILYCCRRYVQNVDFYEEFFIESCFKIL
ncbi:uncharacterized protein TRIADDRAFT_28661 [Trichoplax adhaerens]|uniref:PKD/Chitinase domain-containing protein n=1 Tax=Trichoplax adhaerens TaxID=10228 RepID=B3S423_TRIAD|nr:hypothetical protein TRIADDRAFT_28661 [Trichoplax adhaerens]EDV22385.1 hypothetical protein TRIADDRAFT_28661 [Trichoplax adhaerens]|eukprot:XP_002114929.1 hypothetical protein TRIADDRAFT_28661 [Trichoplax adhaerens]